MPYRISCVVRDTDIDELGHASNLSYLRWVLEAAVGHTSSVGLSPQEYRRRGQSFVVRRHTLEYLRPVLVGDALELETRVTAMRSASSERETIVTHVASGTRVAEARSLWAFVDLTTGRLVRIPDDVRARFAVEPAGHQPGS